MSWAASSLTNWGIIMKLIDWAQKLKNVNRETEYYCYCSSELYTLLFLVIARFSILSQVTNDFKQFSRVAHWVEFKY